VPLGPPQSVAVLGTGLIGASLGLALRRTAGVSVVGYDRDAERAAVARARGALTSVAASAAEAVREAAVAVLAVPLDAVPPLLTDVAAAVRPGTLVTDVGSVKGTVMRAARSLPAGVRFVGGHPMAGAAVSGPEHADALLFENAVWALTPPADVGDVRAYAPEALWLVEAAGARPVVLDAERHDRVAAAVSHLPQLLAVALVEAAADTGDDALGLAAGGFRDMTRIAGSPFAMWEPILRDNRAAVADALAAFEARLAAIRRSVERDPAALGSRFERAGHTRAALPSSSKGFLAPLADVVVWADDRPGVLHALTGVLAAAGLNVKDAELLRLRDGVAGTFRFGFASAADADRAVAALAEAGHRAERR
jgi:prephenate dehydrogenase